METLQVIWFALVAVLLVGYAILDGFDLGVGIWHLFVKKDEQRRMLMASIGPYWDGNEVWLLTGGGALFAAFPHVYATVFSGFYLALMLVLFALIMRAVSLEFRGKGQSAAWRRFWDGAFGIGSSVAALLFGVALGNIMRGLPLDAHMEFTGTFFTLLNPFALLVGVTGFFMLATHGALFMGFKAEGELVALSQRFSGISWVVFLALYVVTGVVSFISQPQLFENYHAAPYLYAVPGLVLAGIVMTGILATKGESFKGFLVSSATIALIMLQVAISIFPYLVPALDGPDRSLSIYNASSSDLTLKAMLVIAIIGMPFVLAYNVWVHRAFAGKVSMEDLHY